MNEISIELSQKFSDALYIGCMNHDSRSIEFFRKHEISPKDAIVFELGSKRGKYNENVEFLDALGIDRVCDFSLFLEQIKNRASKGLLQQISFDVSAFDREMIASILLLLFQLRSKIQLIQLLYYPMKFQRPSFSLDEATNFGPLHSVFFGNTSMSREKLTLVLGAGFELGKAVGAIDVLEPDRVYCFHPVGTDIAFEDAVARANMNFEFIDDTRLLSAYNLTKPVEAYNQLRQVVDFELNERNVLLFLSGPKIFAALGMIIALVYHPAVMVWHYKTIQERMVEGVSNIEASEREVIFRFTFNSI